MKFQSQPGPGAKPSFSSTHSPGSSVVAGCVQLIGLAIGRQAQGAFGPETTGALPGVVTSSSTIGPLYGASPTLVTRMVKSQGPSGVQRAIVRALLDLDVGLAAFRRAFEVGRDDDVDGLRAAEADAFLRSGIGLDAGDDEMHDVAGQSAGDRPVEHAAADRHELRHAARPSRRAWWSSAAPTCRRAPARPACGR